MTGNGARVGLLGAAVVTLAPLAGVGPAPAISPTAASSGVAAADLPPPRTGISPVNFTLHGDAVRGWGFSNATINKSGPNITVYYGDTVNLTLVGADSAPHSWFIDYNNDLTVSVGEPASRDFNVPGNVVGEFSFPAMQPGTWTYRCGMHPNTMTGTIRILDEPRPVNLTLYGDAALGWGFSNATLHPSGPPLVVLWGTNVTLTLIGHDSAPHNWFIDYNNDLSMSPGENASPDFNSPPGTIVVWSFIAQQTGNWTYRCHVHPTSMTGIISIVGGPPAALPRAALPLITEIMAGPPPLRPRCSGSYTAPPGRAARRARDGEAMAEPAVLAVGVVVVPPPAN